MASSSERTPLRRESSMASLKTGAAAARTNDADLSNSLNKLSLSTSPSNTTTHPQRPPSRSPSVTRDSRSPRSSTPNLLRKASASSLRSTGRAPSQPPVPSRRSSFAMAVPEQPPKPAPTASSVAKEYFQSELDAHHGATPSNTETLVILHDACYGHRFSRPRTSRAALSTIVERPERIKAGALGIAMAYVRLGDRHCDGVYPIHPRLDPASIPNAPFRIHKTDRTLSLLAPAVTNVHGTKWMEELKLMCNAAESKLATGGKELQRPEMNRNHDHSPPAKLHEGDLYLCRQSLEAFEGALGAVCEAVDRVFTATDGPRRVFVGVRPPGHHCSASHPSGFCWVNNVHVGIMHAIMNHGLTHAAIIDFDLHHGDGSQGIAWQHNARGTNAPKNAAAWKKASIGYFSLHDINSYPCEMGDEEKVKNASLCMENAHGQNIWNIHLHSWDSETDFWKLYESKYSVLLEKTRTYLQQQAERLRATGQTPKAAIFFSAGFDASEWETKGMQRHNVNVPTEFYARITQDVVKIAAEEGLGVDGRIISVLEGGYSDRALFSGIFSHLSGMVGDQSVPPPLRGRTGLAYEMRQKIGTIEEGQPPVNEPPSLASLHAYDSTWWSSAQLDELETAIGSPPPEAKKPRNITTPTYSSPTQASTAKVSHPIKVRRSMSGLSAVNNGNLSRPPSPPPPDVPWTTATYELSKLLIPSRQTDSCKAEDLKVAPRAPRSASSNGVPEPGTPRMSLRQRKTAGGASAPATDKTAGRNVASEASSLTVKKTRTPATARGGGPRAPRGGRKGVATTKTATAESAQPTVSTHRGQSGADEEMEGITSGMKRIKINLITKSQKERERATATTPDVADENQPILSPSDPASQLLEQPTPPSMAASVGDIASPSVQHAASITGDRSSSPVAAQSGQWTPATEQAMLQDPNPQLGSLPSSSLSAVTPTIVTPVEGLDPDMFVPYQPEGPAPVSVPQQDSLKWLPPNTATPAAVKRGDLPVFTSTSAIPFAKPGAGERPSTSSGAAVKPESSPVKQARAMWDKHNTPQK